MIKNLIKSVLLIFLLTSLNSYGQTVTGNCSGGKCLSFSSFTNCGSGIYKATMVQGTWDVSRFKVYINGTRADLAGYTAGDNCNYDAYLDKNIITASNGGTNKTWYIKVNTNTNRIDLTTSNFTCTPPSAPTITTTSVSSITTESANSGGQSISDNGSSITSKGVCWNTTGNPTISDSKTTNGSGTSSFTSALTSLSHSTTYFVRAYATNGIGTSYGGQVEFTTSSPLPVELTSFNLYLKDDLCYIEWETGCEINNDYFIIEKSKDGLNWQSISTVLGNGNSFVPIKYNYIDKQGCIGTCFYRLTQVDYNGDSETFRPLSVSSDKDPIFSIDVSPNPISDKVKVNFTSSESNEYDFKIISQKGELVYESKIIGVKGENMFSLDLSYLTQGFYFFIISDGEYYVKQKVIK